MVKIKYNLKKILIEEDDIDLVEPFYTKYDEVPERAQGEGWNSTGYSKEQWEYFSDLKDHVKMVLNHHIHNTNMRLPTLHPSRGMKHTVIPDSDGSTRYPTEEEYQLDWDDWVRDYIDSDAIIHIHSDDHMKNFYPGGWIKNFHDFIDSRGTDTGKKKGPRIYKDYDWPYDGDYSLDDED